MKPTKLFFASFFIATTVSADTNSKKDIYVDLGTHIEKLGGQKFDGTFGDNSVLAFSYWAHKTTTFNEEDDSFSTRVKEFPEYLGLARGAIMYGPGIPKTHFNISKSHEITDRQFYSCKMEGTEFYGILYDALKSNSAKCSKVKLFVRPHKD